MQEELKNELKELGLKPREETENFCIFNKIYLLNKKELKLLELMKKNNYRLLRFSDVGFTITYVFELCNPPK